MLHKHSGYCKQRHVDSKDIIEEIKRDLMIDDLVSGGIKVNEVQYLKDMAKVVFKEGKFELHNYHSNIQSLEGERDEYMVEAKNTGAYSRTHGCKLVVQCV